MRAVFALGAVRLVETADVLPGLKFQRGVSKWKVRDMYGWKDRAQGIEKAQARSGANTNVTNSDTHSLTRHRSRMDCRRHG